MKPTHILRIAFWFTSDRSKLKLLSRVISVWFLRSQALSISDRSTLYGGFLSCFDCRDLNWASRAFGNTRACARTTKSSKFCFFVWNWWSLSYLSSLYLVFHIFHFRQNSRGCLLSVDTNKCNFNSVIILPTVTRNENNLLLINDTLTQRKWFRMVSSALNKYFYYLNRI